MPQFPLPRPLPDAPRITSVEEYQGYRFSFTRTADQSEGIEALRHQVRAMVDDGSADDEEMTRLGYTIYKLQQTGPKEFVLRTFNLGHPEYLKDLTEDLTTALWIELSQWDVADRIGLEPDPINFLGNVTVDRGISEVIQRGGDDSIVMSRSPITAETPDGHSGWTLSLSETPYGEAQPDDVRSADLFAELPFLFPFLAMPPDTDIEFRGDYFGAAWIAGTLPPQIVLDRHGVGLGNQDDEPQDVPQSAPQDDSDPGQAAPKITDWLRPIPTSEPVTVERTIGDVVLRARTAPELEPVAQDILTQFANLDPQQLRSPEASVTWG